MTPGKNEDESSVNEAERFYSDERPPVARLKDWTEIIRNLVLTVAVFFGGLWALLEFVATQKIAQASAAIKLKNLQAYEHPVLNITIDVSTTLVGANECFAIGSVSIKNDSYVTAVLDLSGDEGPIVLTNLVYDLSKGYLVFKNHRKHSITGPTSTHGRLIDALAITPGRTSTLPFAIPITAPKRGALYMVAFQAKANASNSEQLHSAIDYIESATGRTLVRSWAAQKIFTDSCAADTTAADN